jgi:hypothetical protein
MTGKNQKTNRRRNTTGATKERKMVERNVSELLLNFDKRVLEEIEKRYGNVDYMENYLSGGSENKFHFFHSPYWFAAKYNPPKGDAYYVTHYGNWTYVKLSSEKEAEDWLEEIK